ncbi:MAG: DUF1015 domain-containing protein [Phycisphaerae bacterium]
MDIRPFRGWRYRPQDGDVSDLIAPPYDVLGPEDKRELLDRCGNNIVAVDLPHVPASELGPDEDYVAAAEALEEWKRQGVLVREEAPAVYAYQQSYTCCGRTYHRRAMLCGLRATPLGEDVIPHEHTFAGPKADRMRLTELTRTQLSPIFAFHEDPHDAAGALWSACESHPPQLQGRLGDVTEKLWVVTDPRVIEAVRGALRDQPAYIADGHHRYTTGLNYRDRLAEAGGLSADHEANFIFFALVPRTDPGLLVLPTHRVYSGLGEGFSTAKLAEAADEFEWRRHKASGDLPADPMALLADAPKHTFVFADGTDLWTATLRSSDAMAAAAGDQPEPWRELDVAIFQKLIAEKHLQPAAGGKEAVDYTPDAAEAVRRCARGEADLACILPATPIEAVEAVADAGASMPHKSTYFYPKLATGMVLKPLE